MGRIKKDYHELDELIARWNMSESDLRYVVENGKLPLVLSGTAGGDRHVLLTRSCHVST